MCYGFLITFTSEDILLLILKTLTRVKVYINKITETLQSQFVHLLNWLYAIMHTNLGPDLLTFTPADWVLS